MYSFDKNKYLYSHKIRLSPIPLYRVEFYNGICSVDYDIL